MAPGLPKYAGAYNNRAATYLEIKKYPDAIADYTKAIELNPMYAKAYDNRGNAYKALGKTKEAEEDFAKAKALEK
ncbi:MAG: tetratricopeptide repeat protein [Planctomycetota bacterium]|nr:tetratricopeptide repeat protein [Planctomycetota bacterium]